MATINLTDVLLGEDAPTIETVVTNAGFIKDSISDNTPYVRQNGTWIPMPAAGIGEAPSDGTEYVRKDAAWVSLPTSSTGSGLDYISDDSVGYGWRLVQELAANHGDIGNGAVDLSVQSSAGTQGSTGDYSFSSGQNTTAAGDYSIAMGYSSSALAPDTIAVGSANTANNSKAITIGSSNTAGNSNGTSVVAIGYSNDMSNGSGVSIGSSNEYIGSANISAIMYGVNNTTNSASIAVGSGNDVGIHSTVVGSTNSTPLGLATVFGSNNTTTTGNFSSIIVGNYNTASTGNTLLVGEHLTASIDNDHTQTVLGNFNVTPPASTAFVLGIGNTLADKNGIEVRQSGEIIAPNPTFTEDNALITKKYAEDTFGTSGNAVVWSATAPDDLDGFDGQVTNVGGTVGKIADRYAKYDGAWTRQVVTHSGDTLIPVTGTTAGDKFALITSGVSTPEETVTTSGYAQIVGEPASFYVSDGTLTFSAAPVSGTISPSPNESSFNLVFIGYDVAGEPDGRPMSGLGFIISDLNTDKFIDATIEVNGVSLTLTPGSTVEVDEITDENATPVLNVSITSDMDPAAVTFLNAVGATMTSISSSAVLTLTPGVAKTATYYTNTNGAWVLDGGGSSGGGVVTDGGSPTLVVDGSLGNYFDFSIDQSTTITTSGMTLGDTGTITLRQTYADNPVTFDNDFKLQGGQPTLTSGGGAIDVFRYTAATADTILLEYATNYAPPVIGWELSATGPSQQTGSLSPAVQPLQHVWRPDGLRMFLVDADGDYVRQYNLTTPWDLTTMTYSGNSISIVSYSQGPRGIFMSADGKKCFVGTNTGLNADPDRVLTIELTDAWSFAGADAFYQEDFWVSTGFMPGGLIFNRDGTKVYVLELLSSSALIHQFHLPTPWTLLGKVAEGSYNVGPQDLWMENMAFNLDGTKLFIGGYDDDRVYEYSLTNPFDVTNGMSYSGNSWHSEYGTSPLYSLSFSEDGTYMFVSLGGTFYRYKATL